MDGSKLQRTADGPLGGVCGGIARKFDIDAGVLRVIWVVVSVLSGGLFACVYAALWLILPRDASWPIRPVDVAANAAYSQAGWVSPTPPEACSQRRAAASSDGERSPAAVVVGLFVGLVLVTLGASTLLAHFVDGFSAVQFWPMLAIAVGVARLVIPDRAGYSLLGVAEGLALLLAGAVVFLSLQGILSVAIADWFAANWPLLLVCVGLLMQSRALHAPALAVAALVVFAAFCAVGLAFYSEVDPHSRFMSMQTFATLHVALPQNAGWIVA